MGNGKAVGGGVTLTAALVRARPAGRVAVAGADGSHPPWQNYHRPRLGPCDWAFSTHDTAEAAVARRGNRCMKMPSK
jgi:hypothetical protein